MAAATMKLTIKTTDLPQAFPDYIDPFESSDETLMASPMHQASPTNRLVEKLREDREPSRHPSPQPSHISMSSPSPLKHNGNGHRILRSATVGYIAPEFKGKAQQMQEGKFNTLKEPIVCVLIPLQ